MKQKWHFYLLHILFIHFSCNAFENSFYIHYTFLYINHNIKTIAITDKKTDKLEYHHEKFPRSNK